MKAERTVVIFGLAAVLLASAVAVAVRAKAPAPGSGTSSATAGDTLRVTAQMTHTHVVVGGTHTEWMVVDVDAITDASAAMAPLDLVIVVDRSSSMISDHKLTAAKAAARQLVGRLRDGDRVGLVSYGTHVTREVELVALNDRTRRSVLAAVDALEANGGTNISAGLEAGHEMLSEAGGQSRLQRLMLLSDGKATAGVLETPRLIALTGAIHDRGVSVTTMGLGLDFNEVLLSQMADQGGGNYYYIREGQQLASAFDREFSTLKTAVVSGAALRVEPAPNATIRRVHGFHHVRDGRAVIVPLSSFFGGENKSLLVELEVAAEAEGAVPVASLELTYVDLAAWSEARHTVEVSLTGTIDPAAVVASVDRGALQRREEVLTAVATDQAMERFEAGENDAAQRILEHRGQELRDLSKTWDVPALSARAAQTEKLADEAREVAPASDEGRDFLKGNRSRSYNLKRSKLLVE